MTVPAFISLWENKTSHTLREKHGRRGVPMITGGGTDSSGSLSANTAVIAWRQHTLLCCISCLDKVGLFHKLL